MRFRTLVLAQLWEMRRNPALLMAPIMVIGMSVLFAAMPRDTGLQDMAPSMLSMLAAFIIGWQVPLIAIAEEREKKILEALLLTPTRPVEVLAAKAFVSLTTTLFCVGALWAIWGGTPARPLLYLGVLLLTLLFTVTAGMLTGLMMPDAKSAGSVGTPIMLVGFFSSFPVLELASPKLWNALAWLPGRPLFEMFEATWTGHGSVSVQQVAVVLSYLAIVIWLFTRQLRRQAFQ